MKLACVIHRFGADIAGGSESHCRSVAERLAATHDVTILTTCAKDHVTWQNVYPEGSSELGPLHVKRFPVARTRSLHRFAELSDVVFDGGASAAEQEEWFIENGPETPALLEHLGRHGSDYDLVLFWAYRYYPTFFGLPLVAGRAVLVPTAEEDPLIRIEILRRFFTLPVGYLFLTPEEADLVGQHAEHPPRSFSIIGTGLDPAPPRPNTAQAAVAGLAGPFLLYLGRVDPNKGCETLFRYFLRYQALGRAPVPLVVAGPANMEVPEHALIKRLGFVDAPVREALLSQARALIMPSPFESLSLVLLEAWNHGVPALVNANCLVLKGQALRANGALHYRRFDEFAAGLDLLLARPDLAATLGEQGLAYIDREYRWPLVMQRLEAFLATLSPSSTAPGSRG